MLAWRLRDKPGASPAPAKADKEDDTSFFKAVGNILSVPTAVCILVGYCALIFGLNGYLTWMPKYLKESFDLSITSAGFHSMFWTHAAAFIGVLVAGVFSDKLAAKPGGARKRLLLQAAGLLLASPCLVLMGLSNEMVVVCAALAGFGFFRAFFDAGTFAILYDVIPPKYYSTSSAVLILFGFGIGSLAPWILGIIGDSFGLSWGIASLSIIWAAASVVLIVAMLCFFDKDARKMKEMEA